jgi:hypothetical protein
MLMAVSVGLAAAQEPAKPPAEPSKAEEKKPEEKTPAPEASKAFEALERALRQARQAKGPAPQGPCAIPLLNVLKPVPGSTTVKPDPMIIVPKGSPHPSKDEVGVPAPSCDDVKKDAEKK